MVSPDCTESQLNDKQLGSLTLKSDQSMYKQPHIFATLVAIVGALIIANLSFAQEEQEAANTAEQSTNADQNQTQEAAKAPKPKTLPDIEAKKRELLKSQYPPNDLRILNAGSEEFTALWRKDQSGDAFGAVLIIPGDGQTANWPNTIDALRRDLPDNGWGTLSIDLKDRPRKSIPKRETANTNAEAGSETSEGAVATIESSSSLDQKKLAEIESLNIQRIQAAVNFLNSEGQYNIILIGYGSSAVRVIDYVSTLTSAKTNNAVAKNAKVKIDRPVRALVLINARNTMPEDEVSEFERLIWRDIPVLDVFFGNHYLDQYESDKRHTAAKTNRLSAYIQLKLMVPSTTVFNGENRLSRRIRGFLNKHAKGVEIDRF